VTGHTQGKGFAGAMKRWGFGGMRAPTACRSATVPTVRPVTARIRAACSRTRRWPATWATVSAPSRTWKIVRTDVERGLLFVKGSVPGSKGGWLLVKDAVKVSRPAEVPYPAGHQA
jgi:large subunit ribosomal protein L3